MARNLKRSRGGRIMRPEGWANKLECEDCDHPQIDDYGYLCELGCGERTRYFNYEAGADAMLEAVKDAWYKDGTLLFIEGE